MRDLLKVFLFVCYLSSPAQIAIKYVNNINAQTAREHLEYLASDELEGREAGQKGQKLAGAYLMQNFIEYGFPPVNGGYFQKFNLRVVEPGKIKISINGDTLSYFQDFLHNSDFDDSNFSNAEVVFIGYGIGADSYNEYKELDLKDKVVMFIDGEPKSKKGKYIVNKKNSHSSWENRQKKIEKLKTQGAKAIIVVNERLSFLKSSYAHSFKSSKMTLATDSFSMKLPVVFISPKTADRLLIKGGCKSGLFGTKKKISKKGKPLSCNLSLKIGFHSDLINHKITSENVLGFIEGTDKKEEVVVVTAHYDHIGVHDGEVFNGADDDGSGTTALLMMAKAFSKAKEDGNGPRRSILFMPVSAEEKGLLGSRYYSENPIFNLKNTVADLNIDMIGRVDQAHHEDSVPNPNYVYIIGSDFLSTELHNINENQNKKHTQLQLDYTYNSIDDPNHYYQRSDHYNFAKHGIPVIFYFNGVHEDYHQASDTVDKIDFKKIAHISKLVYYTVWELANNENRIVVDKK
jgi:hypothetical protein